ncbi:MAG: hypothetical protein UT41_C0001G0241 [Candidatus Wolfebacteria bacterium GW2011_GWC2_39_22]|uniref:Uncharacterized protein n=2 Tax=Candidatus Wolfeibacteriota TaxID=1752735 RepID=A0A0G1HA54_9BACT|nr:MAG: hypothetical protein UT41_C0001G0241 [Candidatus Wolfebacteria bacterium GW2011_GWC2_39_22]KKT43630.1 MAG: hypothetical protein UW32_C0001G0222 [Candidatus Wolfebacteria bacterium GW2011_GWE2_44_13]
MALYSITRLFIYTVILDLSFVNILLLLSFAIKQRNSLYGILILL